MTGSVLHSDRAVVRDQHLAAHGHQRFADRIGEGADVHHNGFLQWANDGLSVDRLHDAENEFEIPAADLIDAIEPGDENPPSVVRWLCRGAGAVALRLQGRHYTLPLAQDACHVAMLGRVSHKRTANNYRAAPRFHGTEKLFLRNCRDRRPLETPETTYVCGELIAEPSARQSCAALSTRHENNPTDRCGCGETSAPSNSAIKTQSSASTLTTETSNSVGSITHHATVNTSALSAANPNAISPINSTVGSYVVASEFVKRCADRRGYWVTFSRPIRVCTGDRGINPVQISEVRV